MFLLQYDESDITEPLNTSKRNKNCRLYDIWNIKDN